MNGPSTDNSEIAKHCASCGVYRNEGDRCAYCGAIYIDGFDVGPRDHFDNALGRKYRVKRDGRQIDITWHWRKPIHWAILAFFLVWNYVWLSSLFVLLATDVDRSQWQIFPQFTMFIVIGIVGTSFAALYCFNKTTITANSGHVSLGHHPVSWRGGVTFQASDITGVFVERRRKSRKTYTWDVPVLQVMTADGRTHDMLEGQLDKELADFEALRRYLVMALGLEYA